MIVYLTTPSDDEIRTAMRTGRFGAMLNPGDAKSPEKLAGITLALDNGRFAKKWTESAWRGSLERNLPHIERCLFAVVPDVLQDAEATLREFHKWAPVVRAAGYPLAYVAQDGLDIQKVPWDDFDAWFLGGSTEFKLSAEVAATVSEAKARGKWAHMGRVNSLRRLRYANDIGCDSADGTFIMYAPKINLPRMLVWLDTLEREAA